MAADNPIYTVGSNLRLPFGQRRFEVTDIQQRESGVWYGFNIATGDSYRAIKHYSELQMKALNPVVFAQPLIAPVMPVAAIEDTTPAEKQARILMMDAPARVSQLESKASDIEFYIWVSELGIKHQFAVERALKNQRVWLGKLRVALAKTNAVARGVGNSLRLDTMQERAAYAAAHVYLMGDGATIKDRYTLEQAARWLEAAAYATDKAAADMLSHRAHAALCVMQTGVSAYIYYLEGLIKEAVAA